MKKIKYILLTLLVLVLIFVAYIAHIGFFTKIEIKEKTVGPYYFVGKEYKGDYKKTGQIKDSIFSDLTSKGLEVTTGFGIYRDDPSVTPTEELRSMIGYIVQEKDTIRRFELERSNYILQIMGETKSMVVEFPFKNQLSIIASVLRVYPALKEHIIVNGYKPVSALELYERNKIIVSMEIEKKE